jgi:hypothetical protein
MMPPPVPELPHPGWLPQPEGAHCGNAEVDNVALVRGLRELDPAPNPNQNFIPSLCRHQPNAAQVGKCLSALKGK